MAVFMNAKATSVANAEQWVMHIQRVINDFRDAIEVTCAAILGATFSTCACNLLGSEPYRIKH